MKRYGGERMEIDFKKMHFDKFDRDTPPTIIPLVVEEYEDLKNLIQNATNQQVEVYNIGCGKLYFHGKKHSELFLRSESFPIQTLVIVRIEVVPSHQGIGTEILEWLIKLTLNKGFKRIVIENANTDDSVQFAKHRGFTKCYNPAYQLFGMESDDDMFCDYELMFNFK